MTAGHIASRMQFPHQLRPYVAPSIHGPLDAERLYCRLYSELVNPVYFRVIGRV